MPQATTHDARRAYLFAGLTVLFWSTVATAFKLTLRYVDIYQLIFYACVSSSVVLLTALALQRRVGELASAFTGDPGRSLLSAALNPVTYYLVLFAAYDRLPAQVAQPINYTWAIVLTFFSIAFLKQRMRLTDIAAAIVCYAGVVLIAQQGELRTLAIPDALGIVLALTSTFIWAGYWVINVADKRDPLLVLCINFLLAVPVTFFLCLVFSDPFAVNLNGLLGAAYVGVFEMGLAFLCWSHALKLAENTSRVSNLIFLSPFLSLVLIYFILGETLYVTTFVGLAIIVAGLILQRIQLAK